MVHRNMRASSYCFLLLRGSLDHQPRLESSNSRDQGQPDQRTRISPNCVQRNAGWQAGKNGR
jgi:hypothetical protein